MKSRAFRRPKGRSLSSVLTAIFSQSATSCDPPEKSSEVEYWVLILSLSCVCLNLFSSLGRMVDVVLALLLLMSGDVETNPGPGGEFLC